jgi:mxaK protein
MYRRLRAGALLLLLIAGIGLTGAGGIRLWQARAENQQVDALQHGQDIAIENDASALLMAARVRFLIRRDDLAGAQAIVDFLVDSAPGKLRGGLYYALGNAHMRRAYAQISKVPFWKVKPIIALAKSEYRQAVQLNPDDWDARYNYAIAASLVHDQEQAKPTAGDAMAHERAAWPDIPGAPNGMP